MKTKENAPEAPQETILKFIADSPIVIADPAASSRAAVANILNTLGVKASQIRLAQDYATACELIQQNQPRLVITDYDLGKKCGLELLQNQREANPKFKEGVFVLVTGNTSQSTVARAAEEDVDCFIIKPFTSRVLTASIQRAILLKVKPPEYLQVIERGKKEVQDGDLESAIQSFKHATKLDSSPTLGCYYLGYAQDLKKELENAEGDYLKGLQYNKIHYKCLVGLFENLMARKKHTEAYEVVKKISQYFPANPKRLTTVLRLAIMTKSYADVERYYQCFTTIDARNDELIKYVCAALVVCGRYYLQQSFGSRALELFQKAAAAASGRTSILREIVIALTDFGMSKQAAEYLRRFPPESQKSVNYAVANLLIADQSAAPSQVIQQGRDLLAQGFHDPSIYQITIRRSAEAGLQHAVDDLMKQALDRFPDQKLTFERAAARGKSGASESGKTVKSAG